MSLAGTGLVGIGQARAVPAAARGPAVSGSCVDTRWQWNRTLGDPGGEVVVGFLLTVMGAWLEVLLFLGGLLLPPDLPDPASELGSGVSGPLASE